MVLWLSRKELLMFVWPLKETCYFQNWSGHHTLVVSLISYAKGSFEFAFLGKAEDSALPLLSKHWVAHFGALSFTLKPLLNFLCTCTTGCVCVCVTGSLVLWFSVQSTWCCLIWMCLQAQKSKVRSEFWVITCFPFTVWMSKQGEDWELCMCVWTGKLNQ